VICFESIMEAAQRRGIVHHRMPVVCKPARAAMEIALEQAGGEAPQDALYFDDSMRNIASGARLGMFSVLVRALKAADFVAGFAGHLGIITEMRILCMPGK
jgi:FMN phosphatase YigB (HAD superfamily)